MPTKRPKVSLGLLVYNGESFLAETIASLLSQTFEDFELVISDNGSTDATQQLCEAYAAKDARIRYFRHPENRGAAWNFTKVFQLSRGEYFKWCAHDDRCDPAFLQSCVEVLDANPSVAWCMPGIEAIDRFGRHLENIDVSCSGAAEAIDTDAMLSDGEFRLGNDFARPCQRFLKVLVGPTACMDMHGLIRANLLARTRLWRSYRGCEKVVMAELSLLGRGVQIPATLFQYRFHSDASIALGDLKAQQQWCDPSRKTRFMLPRLKLIADFVGTCFRHPIGLIERVRCLAAVVRYLLQIQKWGRAFHRMLHGTGMDVDNSEKLRKIESRSHERKESAVHCVTSQRTSS